MLALAQNRLATATMWLAVAMIAGVAWPGHRASCAADGDEANGRSHEELREALLDFRRWATSVPRVARSGYVETRREAIIRKVALGDIRGLQISAEEAMSAVREADIVFIGDHHLVERIRSRLRRFLCRRVLDDDSELILALEALPVGMGTSTSSGDGPQRDLLYVRIERDWGFPTTQLLATLRHTRLRAVPVEGVGLVGSTFRFPHRVVAGYLAKLALGAGAKRRQVVCLYGSDHLLGSARRAGPYGWDSLLPLLEARGLRCVVLLPFDSAIETILRRRLAGRLDHDWIQLDTNVFRPPWLTEAAIIDESRSSRTRLRPEPDSASAEVVKLAAQLVGGSVGERQEAALDLSRMECVTGADRALENGLRDKNWMVRSRSAIALTRMEWIGFGLRLALSDALRLGHPLAVRSALEAVLWHGLDDECLMREIGRLPQRRTGVSEIDTLAALALGRMLAPADVAVPRLTKAITSSDSLGRVVEVVRLLRFYGRHARAAVDMLKALSTSASPRVVSAASEAVIAIEKDVARGRAPAVVRAALKPSHQR